MAAMNFKELDDAIRYVTNFCVDMEKSFDEIDAKGPLFENQSELLDEEKDFVVNVLKQHVTKDDDDIDTELRGLEILSDKGQYLASYADYFSFVQFQPTEARKFVFEDILKKTHDANYFRGLGDSNVLPPKLLDPRKNWSTWVDGEAKPETYDLALVFNQIHLTKWTEVVGIFKGCGAILKKGGLLFTYGPFLDDYEVPQEQVIELDVYIKETNSRLGMRNVTTELVPLAEANGLNLISKAVSPQGLNKFLVWKKSEN